MESTTKLHCLEPFSTTKEADPETGVSLTGKGLGLSKVFATVRELKGGIRVESTPGAGSSIALYLPAEPGSGERVGERTTSPPRDQVSLPSILLIDDDQMVLQTVAAILTDAGYRCATAEDSATALALIREHARHLRLVIVDAIMPGADGAAVVRQIRRLHPGLPVLGFSGAAPTDTRSLLDAGAVEVLRKPLDPRALRAAAERVMLGEVARVA
jgi:CheY-like chemotaxis protein